MNKLNFKIITGIFLLLLSIPFFLVTSGCSVKNDLSSPSDDFPGQSSDSLVVSIQRTRCFGTCPVYTVQFFRSGYVLYEGNDHVEKIGKFYSYVDTEVLKQIGMKAESTGYFNLNDEYKNPHLTDFPTVYTEVRYRGKQKRVTHYDADPPPVLVEMEKFIDSKVDAIQNWQIHPDQNYHD